MKTIIVILLIAALLAGVVLYYLKGGEGSATSPAEADYVQLGAERLALEKAVTFSERALGLSGRPELADGTAMLFVFPENGRHGMWMNDMMFAIDMIWLNEAGEVVDIARNVMPETYPDVFTPQAPARYVLEVNAGKAMEAGVQIGDVVQFGPEAP